MKKRKVRKRKNAGEKTRMKFVTIIGIMIMTVLMGFLTARFIVGPIIGYDSDISPVKRAGTDVEMAGKSDNAEKSDKDDETDKDEKSSKEDEKLKGYALQFGAFSTEDAAEEMADQLKKKGIKCEILEEDSMFKVMSPLVQSKDEALDNLEEISDEDVEDVFIAKIK